MREPEPETIARARAGDLRAFESLVREYQADAWRFAYHLTGNRATAEDVTQEAFLHAFRSFASFRSESKFTSWLLRIVRNCAVDAYRRTQRESLATDGSQVLEEARGRAPSSTSEDRLRISAAIRALPLELREPFVAIEIIGFNYPEASSVLGVKLGTVKSRMHRARAMLVRALDERDLVDEL